MDSEALKAYLATQPSLRLAILYGSLATGAARPDSDVDLAVAGERRLDAGDRTALIDGVGLATGRPVDLVDLRAVGEPLLGQILHHGKRLLVRDELLLAELIKRHLFDSEDFLPYRRRILAERRRAWIGR